MSLPMTPPMAALLRPTRIAVAPVPAPVRRRGHLQLLPGGVAAPDVTGLEARQERRTLALVVVALMILLLALVATRVMQGGPPTAGITSAGTPAVASAPHAMVAASSAEVVVSVRAGESLWSLAVALAPNRDPRPIVDALADRNGGTALRAGEAIVVPAEVIGMASPQFLADRVVAGEQ